MTDPYEPDWYLVSQEELTDLMAFGCTRDASVLKDIATRPHTPAPAAPDITIRPAPGTCSPEPPCDSCKWMQEHDAAIRKDAREQVLDAVCKINIEDNICKKGKNCESCAWRSLRGGV